jgi:hypothetical protein
VKPAAQSRWSFGGLLTGHLDLTASGMAAYGSGIEADKGLYNSDDAVNFTTVAYGLNASVDTTIFSVSYKGSSANNSSGFTQGFGLTADFHDILGGGISIQYTAPAGFSFSIFGGAGAGIGFNVYTIGKKFPGG